MNSDSNGFTPEESFNQFVSFCVLAVILVVVTGVFMTVRGAEPMPVPRFNPDAMPAPKFAPNFPAAKPVVATPAVVVYAPKAPVYSSTDRTIAPFVDGRSTLSPVPAQFRALTGTPVPRGTRGSIDCSA